MAWNANIAQVAVETLILTSKDSLLVKISIFKIALIFQSVVIYVKIFLLQCLNSSVEILGI